MRKIYEIASNILDDWGVTADQATIPTLRALGAGKFFDVSPPSPEYIARTIKQVQTFLSLAGGYRTAAAPRLKAEMKEWLKAHTTGGKK